MHPIPEDILEQFNAVLELKKIPAPTRDEYRKWLLYYLDFRAKYPPPDSRSEQVRLFVEKARSKGRSGKSLQQAANALSLFFQSQGKSRQAVAQAEKVPEMLASLPVGRTTLAVAVPRNSPAPVTAAVVGRVSGRRGGQMERIKALHDEDLKIGYAGVVLDDALEKKYQNAAKDFIWQWFFPQQTLTLLQD
jgi:hypothetical protein